MKLLHDSRCLLKQVHLDNWVEQAVGKSSASLAVFEAYYEKLSFSLYNFLSHFPLEAKKYKSISEIVKSNDCFLHKGLAHAVTLHERGGQFETLQMDAKFITDPLERLLSPPDRNILLKLTALKSRYQRYRMSPDMVQGRVFSVKTSFLDLLIDHSATAVALRLSRNVLARFHHICLDGIRTHDQHLQLLGTEWNELCHDAEEVAAVGDLGRKLEEVAKELFHLRNFYSLCAILSGISSTSAQAPLVFAGFVDSNTNYQLYRTKLHVEPSLPFLYPLIIDLRRGNDAALPKIFSFLTYGRYLSRACKKTEEASGQPGPAF
ncbi:hypothetical protein N7490_006667 [Penicillium lividum]|nr:hypothetical protein N7490_006667 [Penicillium lividum]